MRGAGSVCGGRWEREPAWGQILNFTINHITKIIVIYFLFWPWKSVHNFMFRCFSENQKSLEWKSGNHQSRQILVKSLLRYYRLVKTTSWVPTSTVPAISTCSISSYHPITSWQAGLEPISCKLSKFKMFSLPPVIQLSVTRLHPCTTSTDRVIASSSCIHVSFLRSTTSF